MELYIELSAWIILQIAMIIVLGVWITKAVKQKRNERIDKRIERWHRFDASFDDDFERSVKNVLERNYEPLTKLKNED